MSQQSNTVQTEVGQMYLDAQDSLKLGTYGYYEPEETALIKQLLKPDWTCLDIGAHIGYFTLLMTKRCKGVHAFEADYENCELLRKNLELNKVENFFIWNSAAGESNGRVKLYHCDTNSGMHRVYPSRWCKEWVKDVSMLQLDLYIEDVQFIKMDIEGSELGALKGMKNLLTNSKPTILMEYCPKYIREYGADPREVYYFLKDLGYSIRLLPDKDTSMSFLELLAQTDSEPTGRNILCVKQ
jgi:FkbM family methyltransferase